jgi:TAZ zinc finger
MSNSNGKEVPAASVLVDIDGLTYTAVATAIPSSTGLDRPTHTVSNEFSSIPEARDLIWEDDFFEDEDVVAVFDMDYETMESFYTKVGSVWLGATILYSPLFSAAMLGLAPCYLRKNVQWCVNAQHVAITRDGIRFVRDRRPTCWGLPCTDAGKSSKTIPFDKITDCDLEEPAGNTCLCIENVLSTVNIDTASSGHGRHELQITGLKDPHAFKKLVWAMKRSRGNGIASVSAAVEMVERKSDNADISSLLREIRDELREHNTLLQSITATATPSSGAYQAEPSRTDQRSIDPSPLSIARGPSGSSQWRNDSEWQKVRHKQQRLLLLRHASKCQYEAGQCPVTPDCVSMKRLWEHIAHCRDQQCTFQHCMSSKYVLSHYRRCKDQRCPACGPVRQTIRQSNEKEKTQPHGSSKALDPEQQLLVSVTADMPGMWTCASDHSAE